MSRQLVSANRPWEKIVGLEESAPAVSWFT
jgi:hypothetical protein